VRAGRTIIALLLAAGLIAGCGSSSSKPGLTDGQTQGLVAQLQAARAAAAARDVAGTKAALAKFRRSVVQLRRDGDLSASTARSLRIGAARILQRVESDNAPAPVQAAPAPAQPAPAPPPGHKKKHEEKKKPGKGKGHGDEGGD
jgi:multidrug efflux pump subunit AcrA (membrane-fusion protein)